MYIPLSMYHCGLLMNSLTSERMFSAIPRSRMTESMGLLLRGYPNCLHSDPIAVYIIVFPSILCRAIFLAWVECVCVYEREVDFERLI